MNHNYTIKNIIDKVKKNKRWPDTKLIQRAYNYALLKHGNQKRKSGESYIIHPTNVAYTIAEIGLDEQTICAALLHDVVEDTDATNEDIKKDDYLKQIDKLTSVNYDENKDVISQIARNLNRVKKPIEFFRK